MNAMLFQVAIFLYFLGFCLFRFCRVVNCSRHPSVWQLNTASIGSWINQEELVNQLGGYRFGLLLLQFLCGTRFSDVCSVVELPLASTDLMLLEPPVLVQGLWPSLRNFAAL